MGELNITEKLIYILPLDKTYFCIVDVPETLKPNKELIRLNYSNLSIFEDGDFVFLKDKNRLLIWFVDISIGKKIAIPEAYLIYEVFKKKKDVIVIKKSNDKECVLVIKDEELRAQFCKKKRLDNKSLEILKREFSLKEAETVRLGSDFKCRISFITVLKFLKSSGFTLKSSLVDLVEIFKIPAIIALVVLNTLDVAIYEYVNARIEKNKQKLVELRLKNKGIKEKFEFLKSEGYFFTKFSNENLIYPTVYKTLATVSNISLKDKSKLHMFNQYEKDVRMDIVTPSASKIVRDLFQTNLFSNVEIVSTSQYSKKGEVSRLRLELKRENNVKR